MKLKAWPAFWLLLFCAFNSGAADNEKFFPIMPWNHVPADAKVLARIRECGFTVAGFTSVKALDACRKAGLRAIVQDPRSYNYNWENVDKAVLSKNIRSLIEEVNDHPAVYGYYLRDEPRTSFYPGLAQASELIHELAPGKWAYINLFPNYAGVTQLGAESYREYVEQFVQICKPTQLSYDHYALMDDGSLRGGYWKNLAQMRAVAKKHKLPFWNIVLANAHFDYREPTFADMRFQVFSTLLYGGRGIAYFTYFAPNVGNYRAAPVDQFGNETPTWNFLQNVNLQVQKLAPTLLELTSDEVYHFGEIPNGCHGPQPKSLVTNVTGEFAVGDFTHTDGSRYVMLMNKSLKKSAVPAPQFRSPPKALKLISAYTGQPVDFSGEQVWVAPGQGILLQLEEN